MGSTAVEMTEEELRKEIDELHRQQREITERLRDLRGLRRGGFPGAGPRNVAANGARQRGFVRPADRTDNEDHPPAKRRSAVVKGKNDEFLADSARTGGDSNGNGEQGSNETTQPSQAEQTRRWFEASFAVKKKGKVYGMGSLASEYASSIGVSMYGKPRSKADRQDSATSEEVLRLKRKLAHRDNEIAALKQTMGGMERDATIGHADASTNGLTFQCARRQVDDQVPPAPVAVESSPAQGDDADEDDEQQDSSY